MIVLDNNMILLDREAASWEEAVKLAAACLRENGYIGDTYVNDVIERERSYPTGLPCEEAPIAIPHAFSHDVKRTGVCVIRPKTPVAFRNAVAPDEDLPVELIFLLASVTGADSHLDDLQDLMDCFTRTGLLTDLKKAETPEEFAAVFAAWESYPEG